MMVIDDDKVVVIDADGSRREHAMRSPEAFEHLSRAWLRAGWDTKHVYSFTWLGRPIVQLPEDMFRLQEVIHRVRPDVIVEIGVAHGGSLVFYAGLCKLMNQGRLIGIDIEIRPHNRSAIERHDLSPLITLIEGSSIDPKTVDQVRRMIQPGESVMVLLDGCHTRDHVRQELESYSPLVSVGSYIVAMDGIMEQVAGAPRTSPDWSWNNPKRAAEEFVREHPEFIIEQPPFEFNEGAVRSAVTYWPSGYLRRMR